MNTVFYVILYMYNPECLTRITKKIIPISKKIIKKGTPKNLKNNIIICGAGGGSSDGCYCCFCCYCCKCSCCCYN